MIWRQRLTPYSPAVADGNILVTLLAYDVNNDIERTDIGRLY